MFAILTTHFIKTERISSFFKGVLMIPMITPAVVYSVLWIWLLGSTSGGALNRIYMFVSDGPDNFPFLCPVYPRSLELILRDGVDGAGKNRGSISNADGAKEWEVVRSIILPNLRFHIMFIALWETLGLLTDYTTIRVTQAVNSTVLAKEGPIAGTVYWPSTMV